MSLQHKFLLLIGTLLLAVAGGIAAAGFAIRVVHREVATPFDQMSAALSELGKIKRSVEETARAIGLASVRDAAIDARAGADGSDAAAAQRSPSEETGRAIDAAASAAQAHVDALESSGWHRTRIGVSTWDNIRRRLDASHESARAWARTGDESRRAEARRGAFELHELIEKTELRLLDDARSAVGYTADLRTTLGWWLAAVSLEAGLASVLAVVLLRRWVQTPVGALREAAARIASGDFTHRVRVETTDELGRLMAEVNHMAGMVDQYQREAVERERLAAIGQMVRRIVHNVRNPLAGIRGLAEVSRLDTAEGSEQRENLSLIVSTVDTFERWLSQLLETTRPMDLVPSRMEVAPWIAGIVKSHEPGARAKGVRLELDTSEAPQEAVFDPRHMEHAIAAVVANAIDACPASGSVRVRVTAANPDGNFEILVEDDGPGVPESLRERIFEPHFTTKAHGTGIGLAIARQILRSHGGSITLDPPAGAGSGATGARFRLRLPRTTEPRGELVVESNHPSG